MANENHSNYMSTLRVFTTTRRLDDSSTNYPAMLSFDDFSNNDTSNNNSIAFCKQILLSEFIVGSVRIWDTAILIPNALFLLFLLYKFRRIRAKLTLTNSPVFTAFYTLVYLTTIMNVLRCVVSMVLSALDLEGVIVDKVLWLVLEFFLLSAELSVLSFGLLFGHLDSKTSLRRVWLATVILSFIFTLTQSFLEFYTADVNYSTESHRIVLFSHGGIVFWLSTSAVLCLIYMIVCVLPLTPLRRRFILPAKRRFYLYCASLALLNFLQIVGTGLISCGELIGMCVVCFTSYVYFAFYTPIVYLAFLRGYVTTNQTTLMFSYKPHKDEGAGGGTSGGELPDSANYYPGFPGFTSSNYDDFLYNPDSFYDSTDLNSPGINPLYGGSSIEFPGGGTPMRPSGRLTINANEDDNDDSNDSSYLRGERSAIA